MNYYEDLRRTWDCETGFFYKLRNGNFDQLLYEEFLQLLKTISFENDECVPKKIISLLWYIPLFMGWQKVRLTGMDLDNYESSKTLIENELERILGTP